MEITTIQKNIHSTPRKLALVADMIRGMSPERAVRVLEFTNKSAAEPLLKAIKTVLANAKMQNLDAENLVFKKLEINEGPIMKRFQAGSKGRAKKYTRRLTHIRIVLTDETKSKEKK